MSDELIVVARRAVLPGYDSPQPVTIRVNKSNGRICSIRLDLHADQAEADISVPDHCILLPGLIDCHVHLNQPGRTAWEGFLTGTTAAVSGGVTTLIDMPLNAIPPTTTLDNFKVKGAEAERVGIHVDVGYWGGIIPGNAHELVPLLRAGVKGFKCFLIDSGVEEFPQVGEADLTQACEALLGTNALILFHAEMDIHQHTPVINGDPTAYRTFLESRPPSLELTALQLILNFASRYPSLRFHIVHLSAASALPAIRQARKGGLMNLTVETCFHYLCLSAEDILPNQTQYKCCPPIRDEANRKALQSAVLDGTIDYVVSDHSPCVPELKKGDFMSAWGGVSGLGLGLSLLWTELGEKMGITRVVELLGTCQARQLELEGTKGTLVEGADADFVIFDPMAEVTVTQETLHFKNKLSPYLGRVLKGEVRQTYLRGQLVWDSTKKLTMGAQGRQL